MHQKNPESTEWRDVWEQITHMHHTYTHTHVHALLPKQICQLSLWAPASYFTLNTSGLQVKGCKNKNREK